ncbi:MAG: radical SAM family heme chaperone HemW [Chitinophagaceae bacterium]|nr:radical SAM family heme chaperone HemW [Chitinophagaceae bacterium]
MAGIYIHIPFCKQACHYCNFHFATSLRHTNELVAALLKETALRQEYFGGETVETIYFGGGTPSLLEMEQIRVLVKQVYTRFPVHENAEITLETNPDDITEEKLIDWKETGINRLSIGIQSFFEEDLRWMNRAHTAEQALGNLQLARNYFENITIDLIYGTPGLTTEKWKQNVDTAIAMNIPHLSCYALTVEPKTPLQKLIRLGKAEDVNPDKQSEQFLLLMQWLADAGYEHYEISNFARPGFRSRHNSSYWRGKKYLGIGPSAHSYDGTSRQWNIPNNNIYIESLNKGMIPFEKEILTPVQKLNEYIMTSLRTSEGLDIDKPGEKQGNEIIKKAEQYIERGLMLQEGNRFVLTKEGKLLADGIAADLFFT